VGHRAGGCKIYLRSSSSLRIQRSVGGGQLADLNAQCWGSAIRSAAGKTSSSTQRNAAHARAANLKHTGGGDALHTKRLHVRCQDRHQLLTTDAITCADMTLRILPWVAVAAAAAAATAATLQYVHTSLSGCPPLLLDQALQPLTPARTCVQQSGQSGTQQSKASFFCTWF
jgi:ElaB/YqjD/DUF883 family membrane-anchored ribosome-binding protein